MDLSYLASSVFFEPMVWTLGFHSRIPRSMSPILQIYGVQAPPLGETEVPRILIRLPLAISLKIGGRI